MFRLKRQQQTPVLPLPVRRLWTVGASGSIALSSYILVGYCISQVAGAATLLSVIIATVLAVITGIAYVELTQRTQVTGSPYSFCYTYLGELPAFCVGWAVVGECAAGIALMGKAVTYYSDFLTGQQLINSLKHCCSLAGKVDTRLWNFFDPVAMSAIIIVGVVCAINSSLACKMNQILLLVNFVTVILTIIFNTLEGSTDSWYSEATNSSIFFPDEYRAIGVFKASGIYMHVFLTLATTATMVSQHRGATHSSAISMIVTAIVAIIAIAKAVSVGLLQPYDQLDKFTPVASFMKNVTDHNFLWVAKLNCLGAIVASTAGILSMLVLSANTLEQMVSDGLLWSKLAARRPAISPATTTLFTTAVAAIGAAFHDYEGLILCLSSGTFLVFQALLIAVMVSRSHASRETALLIVLKFTWLLYFFVSPALVVITRHFGEIHAQSAVQGVLAGIVLLFLQLAINWHQLGVKVVVVQVGTSVVMGFSSYIMYQLDDLAWYRLFMWTFIGVMIYTLYGYRKSHLGRGIVDLAVVPEEECVRSLEEGLDNLGFQHELAELGIGRRRRTQRSLGGHSYASARSRHRESFHSAREDDSRRQSFHSVKEDEERKASFKSFSESFKSSRQPSLGLQSTSSGELSPSSQRGVRDEADGGRYSAAAALQRHHEQNRASFKSIRSDQGSFKSVRSESERGSVRGAMPGRRRRVTTDSWRSASSGDSQRAGSGRRQPRAAKRVSPPNSSRAVPVAQTHTPPSSRRATPADVTRTPPSSRRTVAADLKRTPPQTPRRRSSVEILINPRRLYEEMYPSFTAPTRVSTAPADLVSQAELPRTLDGGPASAAAEDLAPVKGGRSTDRSPARHHDQWRGDDSEVSSSDSEWESDSKERRRYSEADIEVVSSGGSGRGDASSDSSDDRPGRALPVAASAGQANKRLTDLGLGDLASVPRGKRSLSMSDISYDDDDDESDSELPMHPRHLPTKGLPKQAPAHVSQDINLGYSPSSERFDDNIPRVHNTAPQTTDSDISAQVLPKIAPRTLVPFHKTLPSVHTTGEADNYTPAPPVVKTATGAGTSSISSTSTDDDEQCGSQKEKTEQRRTSSDLTDPHVTQTTDDNIIQDLEDQIRDTGFLAEHGDLSRRSSAGSEEKHPDLPAADNYEIELAKHEHSVRDSPNNTESDDDSLRGGNSDREVHPDANCRGDGMLKEGNEDSLTPKSHLNMSSCDKADRDEAFSGHRSRSGSEDSAASIDEPAILTHSDHSDDTDSLSERRGEAPVGAEVEDHSDDTDSLSERGSEAPVGAEVEETDTSGDSDSDASVSVRPASAAAVDSEPSSEGDGERERPDHSGPMSLASEAADEGEGDLRPVVRRQMRLPQLPAEARWLGRTPTPPALLSSLGVTDGPRLTLDRSASLPDLSSSSHSGDEGDDARFPALQWRPEYGSDDRDSRRRSLEPRRLSEISVGGKSDEGSPVSQGTSEQDSGSSDSREDSPVKHQGQEQVSDRSESGDHSPEPAERHESDSDSEYSGNTSPAPLRRAPLRRSRQVSDSSTGDEDGSPVPLRRRKDTTPRPAAIRVTSLQGAPPPPRSPAVRLGSLPPLNPEYRPIYRPSEQPSYALGAGRARTALQQARQTFIYDAEGGDEQAVSFEAASLPEPRREAESEGLQVRQELDRLSGRLSGRLRGARSEGSQPPAAQTAPPSAAQTAPPPTATPSAGLTPRPESSPDGLGSSPDVIYC